MSTYIDDSHLAEIGEEYERFVGAYFEKFHSCMVIYQGRILGKQDGGIDLIAVAKDKTYLIQCKNYLPSKLIHENVVNQLSGAAKVFSAKYPSARNVTPTLIYTCQVDDSALYSAHINGITLKRLDYQKKTVDDRLVLFNSDFSTEGYAPISAGLNMLPNYEIRLKALLDVVQERPAPPAAPEVKNEPVFKDSERDEVKEREDEVIVPREPSFVSKLVRVVSKLTFLLTYLLLCVFVLNGSGHIFSHLAYWLLVCAIPEYFLVKPYLLPHTKQIIQWIWCAIAVACVFVSSLLNQTPNRSDSDYSPTASPTPVVTATAKPTTTAKFIVEPTVKPIVKPTATPKPLSKPSNGYYKGFWYTTTGKQHWDGQLNVNTPDDGMYYCLIFVDADNPSNKCFSVFVWPDSEISIDVPTVDNLLLYTVCGKEWYGYDEYFGKSSIWSTSDDIFDFDTYIHTLTFEKVEGGNWETEDIKPYEVPFLD